MLSLYAELRPRDPVMPLSMARETLASLLANWQGIGAIGLRQAELVAGKAQPQRQAALAEQARSLAESQAALAGKQAELASQQAALATRQAAASARTAREVKKLIDEAMAKGIALPTKG